MWRIIDLLSMDSQMWIIINKYQSIHSIPLCHYQIQSSSSWLFEATVCNQYWTNPSSNHHLVIVRRLVLLSFVNVLFVNVGSLVIIWLWWSKCMVDWYINPNTVSLYKGSEQYQYQAGRIDIVIIIESWIVIKNRFVTNKQSIEVFLIND